MSVTRTRNRVLPPDRHAALVADHGQQLLDEVEASLDILHETAVHFRRSALPPSAAGDCWANWSRRRAIKQGLRTDRLAASPIAALAWTSSPRAVVAPGGQDRRRDGSGWHRTAAPLTTAPGGLGPHRPGQVARVPGVLVAMWDAGTWAVARTMRTWAAANGSVSCLTTIHTRREAALEQPVARECFPRAAVLPAGLVLFALPPSPLSEKRHVETVPPHPRTGCRRADRRRCPGQGPRPDRLAGRFFPADRCRLARPRPMPRSLLDRATSATPAVRVGPCPSTPRRDATGLVVHTCCGTIGEPRPRTRGKRGVRAGEGRAASKGTCCLREGRGLWRKPSPGPGRRPLWRKTHVEDAALPMVAEAEAEDTTPDWLIKRHLRRYHLRAAATRSIAVAGPPADHDQACGRPPRLLCTDPLAADPLAEGRRPPGPSRTRILPGDAERNGVPRPGPAMNDATRKQLDALFAGDDAGDQEALAAIADVLEAVARLARLLASRRQQGDGGDGSAILGLPVESPPRNT